MTQYNMDKLQNQYAEKDSLPCECILYTLHSFNRVKANQPTMAEKRAAVVWGSGKERGIIPRTGKVFGQ